MAWLNADDYYFPGALDRVASVFKKNPHVDVVYGNAINVNSEGYFLSYFPPVQPFNQKDLSRSCFICQPACFVRRNAYERIGGIDASLMYTMDWDLWHKLSLSGARFQYVPEVLAAVRYYADTKTMSGSFQRYGEIWRIERKYGRHLLPFCWPGFYRYDLAFKKNKKTIENIFLFVLEKLRATNKRLKKLRKTKGYTENPLYGFHRWDPLVESECTIHMPWYDERKWRKLNLRVNPCDESYRIKINESRCHYQILEGSYLRIDVPLISEPYRKIEISRSQTDKWRLLDFRCELI